MQEEAIPWDPIPHEFNRLSDLDLRSLWEPSAPDEHGVTIIASCAPLQRPDEEHQWRLVFLPPYGYRVGGGGDWPDALPLTWPPQRGKGWAVDGGQVALWEVVKSNFIAQTVAPTSRDRAHHYVVMDHDVAYEFIAHTYRVEDLGLAP